MRHFATLVPGPRPQVAGQGVLDGSGGPLVHGHLTVNGLRPHPIHPAVRHHTGQSKTLRERPGPGRRGMLAFGARRGAGQPRPGIPEGPGPGRVAPVAEGRIGMLCRRLADVDRSEPPVGHGTPAAPRASRPPRVLGIGSLSVAITRLCHRSTAIMPTPSDTDNADFMLGYRPIDRRERWPTGTGSLRTRHGGNDPPPGRRADRVVDGRAACPTEDVTPGRHPTAGRFTVAVGLNDIHPGQSPGPSRSWP
jgi:hypothetical protein